MVDAVPEAGEVRVVATGQTPPVPATAVPPRFEDGFMILLRRTAEHSSATLRLAAAPVAGVGTTAVEVRDLVRKFGEFTAVDHISFAVRTGEIFGLLGPNGAGKTTTFRMLCGLLPASGGTLNVAGVDLRAARASARQRIGYVAQKFSLYGQLSVTENLDFFAGAYGLTGKRKAERIRWALREFRVGTAGEAHQRPTARRLQATAGDGLQRCCTRPEILFLGRADQRRRSPRPPRVLGGSTVTRARWRPRA